MTAPDREALRELAEDAPSPPLPPGSAARRVDGDGYTAEIGPQDDPDMNIVSRLRLDGRDLAAVVAEVHDLFADAGRRAITWEVSSGATPAGLLEQLRGFGMETHEPASMLALACTVEPSSGDGEGITVARVETDAQFHQVREVFEQGDGWSPGDEWLRGPGFVTRYLAFIDGRPVATADITWLADERAVFLGGALTLPEFRGRGAYRALVHERWREAGGRGREVLVTQSEPMSQPILKRLGFEVVGEISVLIDRF
ncbi:MAG TPA: GNAT family N-acetyltransferase [Gaiellales bacterium]|nr:GNAT family N-acetyltransferase [Gaiellales bacterium]